NEDDKAAARVILGDAPAVGDGLAQVTEDPHGLGAGAVLDADLDGRAGHPRAERDVGAAAREQAERRRARRGLLVLVEGGAEVDPTLLALRQLCHARQDRGAVVEEEVDLLGRRRHSYRSTAG